MASTIPKTMSKWEEAGITFRSLRQDDLAPALRLVTDWFQDDEPVTECVRCDPEDQLAYYMKFTDVLTADGSFVAETAEGVAVAVFVGATCPPPCLDMQELSPRVGPMVRVFEDLWRGVKLSDDGAYGLFLVAVHPDHRGLGLCGAGCKRMLTYAREHKYAVAWSEACSAGSTAAMKRLGFQETRRIAYRTWVDEDGTKPLAATKAPHDALRLITLDLRVDVQ